jgi:hypothetical protein
MPNPRTSDKREPVVVGWRLFGFLRIARVPLAAIITRVVWIFG